jgi:hypothetical protein
MRYTNTNIIIAHNNINNTIAGIIISRKNDDEDDEEDEDDEDKSDSEEDEETDTDTDADADDDDCEEDEAPENEDLLLSNMPVTPSES